ncbi:mandelate racemase/muconate lactonizing enzyme family protein [Candidatus Poribacteria bacterium]|nr:mandelate racemase/muconate lactonizing enzyme family protein [Candidatus Poribacteria bacterium]MYB01316.1 mandelate racemase/muconate lactonizing enzyme family protein [Candidatus Poribacteria bacterium]
MEITQIEAFALRFQTGKPSEQQGDNYYLPDEGWRCIYARHHETMVVRITTSDGIVGYGEGQSPVSPRTSKTIVEDLCRPILIGKDPFDVEYLWQRMFTAMRERGHYTGFFIDALAGCDIALWDIIGQATERPVHKVLGGRYRDRIPLYAGIGGNVPESAAAQAAEYVSQGYGGLKIHATSSRPEILEIVAAVRERVGPQIKLMVDVHTQYSIPDAILLGRGLEKLDVMWLESPTVPEDIPGQAALAQALDMSVAIGEWTRTRFELREVFERRACDITMPDIARTGLTEGKRIASLADTYNIPVTPHIGGGGILSIAATIQFSATIPNFLIMEHSPGAYEMKGQITTRKPTVQDGAFILDDTPGIGVTINTEALEAFAIEA